MASTRARKALLACLTAVAAVVAGLTVHAAPPPAEPALATAASAADELPLSSAVEDGAYPDAERIHQEQKILLKNGDGNIVFVACDGSNDIIVKNRVAENVDFCFDVRARPGFLTLELPKAFALRTHGFPVTATITAGGKETVINAGANDFQPFGEGLANPSATVVELRVPR